MDAYYTGGLLGISRIDSFMDSRPRVNYTGAATYEFQSARPTSGAVDYTEIKDYGGTYMEATWTPAVATPVLTRYDGITKPAYGRNPGVSLRARDPGGDPLVFTTANIATQAKEVDVLLNPSTPDWLSRGVAPGDHIVCTVMHDYDVAGTPFTGAVSAITLSVGWQGWGRVSEIDPALPHVARVVGMDIHRLHTVGVILADNTLGGFSLDVAFPGQFGLTTKVVAAAPLAASPVPDGVEATLVHLGFGTVLGPDKKPLKTRSGSNFKLMDLLQAAVDRGTEAVRTRAADPNAPTHGLADADLAAIGAAVGIAAIKYADLSGDTGRDYVFDLDRMIAFEGDTGPYLQYAHARLSSMLEKAGDVFNADATFKPETPEERRLALLLLRFGDTVRDAAASLEPSRLCRYLYAVATEFSTFYSACPVLKADDPAVVASRLRLVSLVRRVLADGLDCLGIEAPPRM